MCKRIRCSRCNKYTWTGCGRHIESVLSGVKPEYRCCCDNKKTNAIKKDVIIGIEPRKKHHEHHEHHEHIENVKHHKAKVSLSLRKEIQPIKKH